MPSIHLKKFVLAAGLLVASYVAGIATPTVHAYTQDETRLMNQIAGELTGIRRSLDVIARKLK